MAKQKSKHDRFHAVAAKRVQKVLDALESLGKCSNPGSYEYTPAEVKKMELALKSQVRTVVARFRDRSGGTSEKGFRF